MDTGTILNAGDVVVVRDDLEEKNYPEKDNDYSLYATQGMADLHGQTVVIESVVYGWGHLEPDTVEDESRHRRYTLKNADGESLCPGLLWCPSMFSGYATGDAAEELPEVSDEDASAFLLCLLGGDGA